MTITELIKELETLREMEGDLPVLVEVSGDDGCPYMMPAEELNTEERDGHGKSVSILS